MRPLELKVRDFRSYRGESIFDLRTRRLVGVVGPIGSGKSTLLDAVAFALYGKTPNVAGATKALIHQRAAGMTVSLRFQVESEVWEVVRSLRRKGQSQHALYRYADDTASDPDDPDLRITGESDVNGRIVELLGLDFDAFRRSVLLPQGRFADFLRARPGERDAVLKGVFGHDRIDTMQQIARDLAAGIGIEIEKLGLRLDQIEQSKVLVAAHGAELAASEDRVELLAKAEPRVADLDSRIKLGRATVESSGGRLRELHDHESRLPRAETVDTAVASISSAAGRRAEAMAKLEACQSELQEADDAVTRAESAGATTDVSRAAELLASVAHETTALGASQKRLATVEARLAATVEEGAAATERADRAVAAESDAAAGLGAAVERYEASQRTLHDVRHVEMAHTLRRGLVTNEACPVCSQLVTDIPDAGTRRDLDAAEAEVATLAAAREAAAARRTETVSERKAATEATVSVRSAEERLRADMEPALRDVSAVETRLDGMRSELAGLLGEGEPAELLEARRRELASMTERAAMARQAVARRYADHDEAIKEEDGAREQMNEFTMTLVELGTRLGESTEIPRQAEPHVVAAMYTRLRSRWSEVIAELESEIAAAERDANEAVEGRKVLLGELGVEGDLAEALARAIAETKVAHREIERLTKDIEASTAIAKDRDLLTVRHHNYERLATDLTNSRFIRFLLDDERRRLGELGSEHFQDLTSGRYRFSDDGEFRIVDLTAADAVRKADSLSGGETFLASLALALALAEMVARGGGRLDAFFLDEGFGTLDPEHLDLAMDGIEALVSDERLVMIVSHVPELRHRIEDLIELDRDPTTGDTKVLRA